MKFYLIIFKNHFSSSRKMPENLPAALLVVVLLEGILCNFVIIIGHFCKSNTYYLIKWTKHDDEINLSILL